MSNDLKYEIISYFYRGKAIFKIHILNNELYNSYNIKEISISDSNNINNTIKNFSSNEIIYESYDIAYVEITKSESSSDSILTNLSSTTSAANILINPF